jgi:hypothetical protein
MSNHYYLLTSLFCEWQSVSYSTLMYCLLQKPMWFTEMQLIFIRSILSATSTTFDRDPKIKGWEFTGLSREDFKSFIKGLK